MSISFAKPYNLPLIVIAKTNDPNGKLGSWQPRATPYGPGAASRMAAVSRGGLGQGGASSTRRALTPRSAVNWLGFGTQAQAGRASSRVRPRRSDDAPFGGRVKRHLAIAVRGV